MESHEQRAVGKAQRRCTYLSQLIDCVSYTLEYSVHYEAKSGIPFIKYRYKV